MNKQAIERDIFFAPFGYSLFGQHEKDYNPIDNDRYSQGSPLFGFSVRVSLPLYHNDYFVLAINTNKENNDYEVILTDENTSTTDLVDSVMSDFAQLVISYGPEEYAFTFEDFERWKNYIRDYIEKVISLELSHAKLVIEEMKRSGRFKI